MKYYYMKLIPPRPTFAQDMNDEERRAMQEHIFYWKILMEKGVCLLFGPVLDPKGVYGVTIVRVEDDLMIPILEQNDPSVMAGINTFESYPMAATVPLKERFN